MVERVFSTFQASTFFRKSALEGDSDRLLDFAQLTSLIPQRQNMTVFRKSTVSGPLFDTYQRQMPPFRDLKIGRFRTPDGRYQWHGFYRFIDRNRPYGIQLVKIYNIFHISKQNEKMSFWYTLENVLLFAKFGNL